MEYQIQKGLKDKTLFLYGSPWKEKKLHKNSNFIYLKKGLKEKCII